MTKKLSQLPEHSSLTSTGTFIVVDNGMSLRYPLSALNSYIAGGGHPVSELINENAVVSLGADGVLTLPIGIMGPLVGPGLVIDVSTASGYYNVLSMNGLSSYMGLASFNNDGSTVGIIQTNDGGGNYYGWSFQPDGRTSFPNYTFPAMDGTATQILVSDGGGSLIWANQPIPYTLTSATNSTLGGVKIGSGVHISSDGTISVTTSTPYTLTSATNSTLGGVKIGSGVNISSDGTISVTTGSYTLTSATNSTLGGVKIGSGVNVSSDGTISVTTGSYSLPTASTSTLGGVKVDGTSITINSGTISSNVTGLISRTTGTVTTVSLTSGTSTTTNIVGYKGYALLNIQVSSAAWVTVYSSTATQAADAGRSISTDPTAGSGVIAETITTSSTTTYFSPAVIGYSSEAIPTTNIPVKIYNNSSATTAITVTLTLIRLEA